MSSIKLSPNASGTGAFTIAAPNSNTDRTLTLPDNTGTILTTGTAGVPVNGPAFSAYGSALQSVANLTFTKINFNTEEFDTNSNYDTTLYRFTPTVAGYYQFNVGCFAASSTAGGASVSIYKNGSEVRRSAITNTVSGTNTALILSAIIYANGSTDYFEAYAWNNNGPFNMGSNNALQSFSGALVRSA